MGKKGSVPSQRLDTVEAVARSSRGGLSLIQCAFYHPEVVDNILSPSSAYWASNNDPNPGPWPRSLNAADLVHSFRDNPCLPLKFYLEVAGIDSLLDINQQLRAIPLLNGDPATKREFNGARDSFDRCGFLADGLITLIGQKRPCFAWGKNASTLPSDAFLRSDSRAPPRWPKTSIRGTGQVALRTPGSQPELIAAWSAVVHFLDYALAVTMTRNEATYCSPG